MDEATRALAAEVVTLPGWRWMPGMRGRDVVGRGFLLVALHHSGGAIVAPDGAITTLPVAAEFMARCLPDLADPATLGCLLALVREAWRDPRLVAIYCEAANPGQSEGWGVQTADNRLPIDGVGDHPTEAHALVAALRAAGHD